MGATLCIEKADEDDWPTIIRRIIQKAEVEQTRTIIFVFYVSKARELADQMGSPLNKYDAQHPNDRHDAVLQRFIDGHTAHDRVLFATSTICAGVDIPNMDYIIHVGLPANGIIWEQGVGRGG